MTEVLITSLGVARISEKVIKTVAMESAGESQLGMVLVASVIVNRGMVLDEPLDDVVAKHSQFSCWNDAKKAKEWLDAYYTPKVRKQALEAIKEAISDEHYQKMMLTNYHRVGMKPKPHWAKNRRPDVVEGKHAFYALIN